MDSEDDMSPEISLVQAEPHHGRRRLRTLAMFPTLLTLGNLTCGFAAIYFAGRALYDFGADIPPTEALTLNQAAIERMLPSFLSIGAGLVFLGMFFDCFDGLVARATRSTTDFGGQLDSLADMVTCGAAPAMLMVAFIFTMKDHLHHSAMPSPISEYMLGRTVWVCAAIYVAMAAVRLARYNVEHSREDFDHTMFRGLPSPGAAAVIATLILCQEQFDESLRVIVAYAMPVVALLAALLMVSQFPYKRFYRIYLVGRHRFETLIFLALLFAVFWSAKAMTLLVLVLWYMFSGPIDHLIGLVRKRRGGPPGEDEVPEDQSRRHA